MIITVYSPTGEYVGMTTVKPDDKCKVEGCGKPLSEHNWVAADNGTHLTCNLAFEEC